MSSALLPHPLDVLFDAGKRRRKQYFPETVPGLYTLSKTEVSDDIDRIEFEVDRSSPSRSGHPRRRVYRMIPGLSDEAMSGDRDNSNKRTRLMDKILAKSNELSQLKPSLSELRSSLDTIRHEVAQHYDGIARLERQIRLSDRERKLLEDDFKSQQDEYQQVTRTLESRRAMFETSLKSARDRVNEVDKEVKFLQSYQEDMNQKDARIRFLEMEVDTLKMKQLHAFGKAENSSNLNIASGSITDKSRAPEASAATQDAPPSTLRPTNGSAPAIVNDSGETEVEIDSGSSNTFYHSFFQSIDQLKDKLSSTMSRVVELENQKRDHDIILYATNEKLDKAKQEKLDVLVDLRAKEKQLEQQVINAKTCDEEAKKFNSLASRLTRELQLAQERLQAQRRVVDAVEHRATEAEKNLLDCTRSTHVLKCGLRTLQEKFNLLFKTHAEAVEEKARLAQDLERSAKSVQELEAKLEVLAHGNDASDDATETKLRAQVEILQRRIDQLCEQSGNEQDVEMKDSTAAPEEEDADDEHDEVDEDAGSTLKESVDGNSVDGGDSKSKKDIE